MMLTVQWCGTHNGEVSPIGPGFFLYIMALPHRLMAKIIRSSAETILFSFTWFQHICHIHVHMEYVCLMQNLFCYQNNSQGKWDDIVNGHQYLPFASQVLSRVAGSVDISRNVAVKSNFGGYKCIRRPLWSLDWQITLCKYSRCK